MKNTLKTLIFIAICFCFSLFAAASPPESSKTKAFSIDPGTDQILFARELTPARSWAKFTSGKVQDYAAVVFAEAAADRKHSALESTVHNAKIVEELIKSPSNFKNPSTKPPDYHILLDLPPNDAFSGLDTSNQARAKI